MKGGFLEIPKALSFQLDVLVRLAREELLEMIDLGWHAQHRGAALCGYATPSCFVAEDFPRLSSCGHQHAVLSSSRPTPSQAEDACDDISKRR